MARKNVKVNFSTWPKPYSWMVGDLERSIYDAKANYLVGLGLFCYTEIIGREIAKWHKFSKTEIRDNLKCFNLFFGEYMGYKGLLKKYGPKIYDSFRNGLCHEYSIKPHLNTGIFVSYGFKTSRQGIVILKDKKMLVMKPYLRDFKKGIYKFLKNSNQI